MSVLSKAATRVIVIVNGPARAVPFGPASLMSVLPESRARLAICRHYPQCPFCRISPHPPPGRHKASPIPKRSECHSRCRCRFRDSWSSLSVVGMVESVARATDRVARAIGHTRSRVIKLPAHVPQVTRAPVITAAALESATRHDSQVM